MSILSSLRFGVELANKITRKGKIQAEVMYERQMSVNEYGDKVMAAAVPLHAIVDFTSKQVRTKDGTLTVTRATIDLLDIKEVAAATNGEGIDNNDKFTLPDGDTGPILDLSGFIDAGTTHPIATTVMLG